MEMNFFTIPLENSSLIRAAILPLAADQKSIFADEVYEKIASRDDIDFVPEELADLLIQKQHLIPHQWRGKEFIGLFTKDSRAQNKVVTIKFDTEQGQYVKDYHFFTGGAFGYDRPIVVKIAS